MEEQRVSYDAQTMRFTQGNNLHNDYIECPFCHAMTMKLVSETENKKFYRCDDCNTLMSEGK